MLHEKEESLLKIAYHYEINYEIERITNCLKYYLISAR
jgi:hypothetical protein